MGCGCSKNKKTKVVSGYVGKNTNNNNTTKSSVTVRTFKPKTN
jgi:hypothetical protein